MESGYLYVDNNIFPTLLAISEDEQSKGLQYRAWPPPVMSFIYVEAKVNKFWMHKTPSPLDIVFCHQGVISQIHKGDPYSTEIIGENKPSDLIVEFPFGTVKDSKIQIGDKIGLVKPTFDELKLILAKKYDHFVKL